MKITSTTFIFSIIVALFAASFFGSGCAQIGVPSGGIKDTIPPRLVKVSPPDLSKNVTTNKFNFTFDEYIDVQDISTNVIISPLQLRLPTIIVNPRDISLKFRDSLLPNTTYTINFGNAIRDINENNILHNLTYTFSTGNKIDSLLLAGTVTMAETGTADSTMQVLLYRNLSDSAVQKIRPDYVAVVRGDGSFVFHNLPPVPFRIYALKDRDGSRTYNGKTESIAFINDPVTPSLKPADITLLAYASQKDEPATAVAKAVQNKKLSYSNSLRDKQDLQKPFEISFNNALRDFDSTKIILTDTNFIRVSIKGFKLDSTARILSLNDNWIAGTRYNLILEKDAVHDSAGIALTRTDTIHFTTKTIADYGRLTLRFTGIDMAMNPVLRFVSGAGVMSFPITSSTWTNNMFPPGEYTIQLLYDTDRNGKWTPGNFEKRIQPESVLSLPQKLNVRADWDNERDISF